MLDVLLLLVYLYVVQTKINQLNATSKFLLNATEMSPISNTIYSHQFIAED